jgi:tRNA-specific 2-thiouridylase
VIDTRDRFRTEVIDDFVTAYTQGVTPNPCVRCNERVKIRELIQLADERGIDYVATGHYVQISNADYGIGIQRSNDLKKDQSYFLYRLNRAWLPRLLFPVGHMHKTQVWSEAEALGLPADELKESQEICFVSHGDYRNFLEQERPSARTPGNFVDQSGALLGQHDGIAFYTPGQRRGLGIAAGRRLYVHHVNPTSNTVILGPEASLYRSQCTIADLNLFDPSLIDAPTHLQVKIRYATPAVGATIEPLGEGTLSITFDQPQKALSPGQSAVFYRGEQVLGGGIIQPFEDNTAG